MSDSDAGVIIVTGATVVKSIAGQTFSIGDIASQIKNLDMEK